MSGHLYYSEMLLEKRESDSDDKSSCQSGKRYEPAFQYEYILYELVLCSQTAQGRYVRAFLDYKHRQTSENVECNYYDDEYEDHEYGSLFIFHHLV